GGFGGDSSGINRPADSVVDTVGFATRQRRREDGSPIQGDSRSPGRHACSIDAKRDRTALVIIINDGDVGRRYISLITRREQSGKLTSSAGSIQCYRTPRQR